MILLTAAIVGTTILAIIYHRFIYIVFKTLPRDILAGARYFRMNLLLWSYEKRQYTVPKIFQKIARKHPKKIAFHFEDKQWTFEDVDHYSNQIANFFKAEGFRKGDAVALLMESCPEYVIIWLGLSKIGVITALINNNLVAEPLFHSITVANATAVIYGSYFKKVIEDLGPKSSNFKLYQFNEAAANMDMLPKATDLRNEMAKQSGKTPQRELDSIKVRDNMVYIYTSGTTGLPKAAVVTHMRFMLLGVAAGIMIGLKDDDIIYDPLPLYHSAGGVLGVGQAVLRGVTVVIRKKFSASGFWTDCIKYKCTVAQYIGETCRYILAVHSNNNEPIKHNVRFMFGNGLRPQIWEKFTERFNVKQIYELYGATEGNSNLINIDNKVGAIGFVPVYAGFMYPCFLIQCDQTTGEPIRNADGFCIKCKVGEPGVFIGKIDHRKPVSAFSGYADKKATEKKIIKDVFKNGDLYFISGDVLIRDEFGYFYFKDRTGDTFRWKGENVATSEVEAVISNVVGLKDATVYGVQVPGTEGRAGMAAVVDTDNSLDMNKLAKGLKEKLPAYAIPLFLRVMKSVPMTGTFKLKKVDLQKDGFNLYQIKDALYSYDPKQVAYIKMTEQMYEDIMSMKIRL